MSLFLKATVLAEAVANIKDSSARSRLLEFLILKRTQVLDGKSAVVFAEGNANYKKAIVELADIGLFDGKFHPNGFTYINVFAIGKGTTPYRASRFPSNGPNTTVGGNTWAKVVDLNTLTSPRTVNLTSNYLSQIEDFLLYKGSQYKGLLDAVSLIALAFWFYRYTDLGPLLGEDARDLKKSVEIFRANILQNFAFSEDELDSIFDVSDAFLNEVVSKHGPDIFTEKQADASEYLAPPSSRAKREPSENEKWIYDGVEHSKIVYGAPGTGKSWIVNDAAAGFEYYTRVTFYPDYSFFQFVGGYKPKSLYAEADYKYHTFNKADDSGIFIRRPVIDYAVVPGPFMSMLVRAYQRPEEKHLLIIEELNRANAAAVFGDLFQLLDRNEEGLSTYAATVSIEMSNWLLSQKLVPDGELIEQSDSGELKLRLPKNFFIWATMNSADQGVQPLDAAFKRRWTFQYVPLNSGEAAVKAWTVILAGRVILWNKLRRVLNKFLVQQGSNGRSMVAEDRLLGPFFMKASELADGHVVLNKLMLYLRDDLVRHNPAVIFASGVLNFSDLYDTYTEISEGVVQANDSAKTFFDDLQKLFTSALAGELSNLYIAAEPELVVAEDE
jgi:hypothetical protein